MKNKTEVRVSTLITRKDYRELWRASPIRFLIWILFAVAAFYFYWAFAIFVNDGYTQQTATAIVMFCFVAFLALLSGIIVPKLRTRLAFRGPLFQETTNYLIDEYGLRAESELFSGHYRWGAFNRVKETNRAFLFFVSPLAAMLVPKRCISNMDGVTAIRELVSHNFKGKKQLRS